MFSIIIGDFVNFFETIELSGRFGQSGLRGRAAERGASSTRAKNRLFQTQRPS